MAGRPRSATDFDALGAGRLPGLLGIEIVAAELDSVRGRMEVRPHHLAPNGYLHAASVIALADTLCGYGTVLNLPEGARGFTTIELKSNFLGTALEGTLVAEARPLHRGRTTQVWDAEVANAGTGEALASFRCTQLVLWPRR